MDHGVSAAKCANGFLAFWGLEKSSFRHHAQLCPQPGGSRMMLMTARHDVYQGHTRRLAHFYFWQWSNCPRLATTESPT
jgi:hypothetical protein